VVEVFEDIVPVAAAALRNRCMPGSSTSLAGTTFHKLLQGYGIFGGRNRCAATGPHFVEAALRARSRLHRGPVPFWLTLQQGARFSLTQCCDMGLVSALEG
jgi:hypothetical protein